MKTIWRQHVVSRTGNNLDPSRNPSSSDVIFAAGFYEGEGSCHASKISEGISVSISQKDPEFLYRLRDFFGGSVVLHMKAGRPAGYYDWRLCGERCRSFLKLIYPYLTSRRKAQIEKTTAFRPVITPNEVTRERLTMTKQERKNETQRRYMQKNRNKIQENSLIQ